MMSLRQTSLPHILFIILTLTLAGCGDSESGSAAAAQGTSNSTSNDSTQQNASNTDSVESGPAAEQSFIRPVGDVDNGKDTDNKNRHTQPGKIENPILAAPLPVPVPKGEGPASGKDTVSDGKKAADREKAAAREERKRKEKEEKRRQEKERKKKEKEEREKNADKKEKPTENEPEPVAERPSLRWDSPMTREDGSKLFPGEISGFKVHYKLLHQKKYKTIDVEGAHIDQLALDNFSPGAYEFSVSTVDTNGIESQRSQPVQVDLI